MEQKRRTRDEIKDKLKKAAIIVIPVAFALIATVSVALLMGGLKKASEDGDQGAESYLESRDQVMAPVEDDEGDGYSRGLEYRSNSDGTASVVGLGSCTDKTVRIPETTPDGERITDIGDRAFAGEKGIVEVKMPTGIVSIGKEAFKGSGITAVTVPSSVITIGDGAFARCTSLSAIKVDAASPMFTASGGVLFDIEMETLICYPSGKEDSTYVIPKTVTKISSTAFSACNDLTKIRYSGTKKQWKNVYICTGNDWLDVITITYAAEDK